VFRAGIIAAVIVALAGLSACDGFVLDDQADRDWEMGIVDANGLVQVRVPIPGEVGNRSVADGRVKTLTDYYEVVFRETVTGTYYRGTSDVGRDFLSVSVLPDKYYDVLFLAGIKKSRVLLAAAYTKHDTTLQTNYIKVGQANTVHLTVGMTNITPDDNDGTPGADDIVFADPGTNLVKYARDADGVATLAVDETWAYNSGAGDNIQISLKQTKLKDLIAAAKDAGAATVFDSNSVVLSPRYNDAGHNFYQVAKDHAAGDTEDGVASYTYTILTKTYADIAVNGVPADVDGMLKLELKYRAFGPGSGNPDWYIRNGVFVGTGDIDDEGNGGLIRVQFGTGSELSQEVGIDLGSW
jgi:hypothetical protein